MPGQDLYQIGLAWNSNFTSNDNNATRHRSDQKVATVRRCFINVRLML